MAGGFGSTSGPRPCLSSHAYRRTVWPAAPASKLPNKCPRQFCFLCWRHTSNKNNTLAETVRDTSEVARGRAGVVVYLHWRGRKDPCAFHDDRLRLPRPRERQQGRKEKFPLTEEIGTSCAATQSNHLSYFTDRPAWHKLATQGYFVFRSTVTHQPSPEQISSIFFHFLWLTQTVTCYKWNVGELKLLK